MSSQDRAPRISVVMGVYNGEAHLAEAVESILAQSYRDFEFIIIDDGSQDRSGAILAEYEDPRLRLVTQSNQGLTCSLNRAIGMARGEYIARMDADDVALPHRFARQIAFLEANPDVVLLGTGWRQVDLVQGKERNFLFPTEDEGLRHALAWGNPFCHSSVIMRADALARAGGYDESFRYVQDYELWSRLAGEGKLANLPSILMQRRHYIGNTTSEMATQILRLRLNMRAQRLAILRLGLPLHYLLLSLRPLLFFPLELLRTLRARRRLEEPFG